MLRLRCAKSGKRRTLPLEEFFIAYGKQDREKGELLESISIPYLPSGDRFAVYKVTKRFDEDITAVCGAFRISLDDNGRISAARFAFGGMAATPKRAAKAEAAVTGKIWSEETVEMAVSAIAEDFTPLTDMRATASYRMLVAKNLLRRFLAETSGAQGQLRLIRQAAE